MNTSTVVENGKGATRPPVVSKIKAGDIAIITNENANYQVVGRVVVVHSFDEGRQKWNVCVQSRPVTCKTAGGQFKSVLDFLCDASELSLLVSVEARHV